MGYDAVRLAGEGVFRPPKDRAAAVAGRPVAVETDLRHFDTSDFFTNCVPDVWPCGL